MSCLIEHSWILSSVSAFSLQYVVFVETYGESLTLHRYVVGKERSTLIAFSDTCRYSLVPHQNLQSGSFLDGCLWCGI